MFREETYEANIVLGARLQRVYHISSVLCAFLLDFILEMKNVKLLFTRDAALPYRSKATLNREHGMLYWEEGDTKSIAWLILLTALTKSMYRQDSKCDTVTAEAFNCLFRGNIVV